METTDPAIVNRLKKLPPYDDVVEKEETEPTPEPQTDPEAVTDDSEGWQAQEEVETEEETTETEETPVIETENERTKQNFNKVLEENKQLKQQIKRKSVVESLRPEQPAYVPQAPVVLPPTQEQFVNLVDADGYVDTKQLQALAEMTRQANERAIRAEQVARQAEERRMTDKRDFEETQQMREIHKEFPELDPNGPVFDETLFDAVRNELVSQYTKGENDIYNAVSKWHKILINPMKKKEALKKAEQKSQIQATVPKSTRTAVSGHDFETLRQGTLHNVKGSLAERLKRSGY